jgi:hypothetical protein
MAADTEPRMRWDYRSVFDRSPQRALADHVFSQHAADHVTANAHKLVLGIEIVERCVGGVVQTVQNQVANRSR